MAEFLVNGFTLNDQDNAAVARDAAGNFIVVWQSEGQDGDAATDHNIYARRYDSTGNLLNEFRVNSVTTGDQSDPTVAVDAAGNILVAWIDAGRPTVINSPPGNTTDARGIYARRFDSACTPLGAEFLASRDQTVFPIGTDSPEMQLGRKPSLAVNASGDFVLAWDQFLSATGAEVGVFARRFSRSGLPQGAAFQVNDLPDAEDADLAIDAVGNVIVTWTGRNHEPGDGGSFGIFAKRYNNAGLAQGGQFLVNSKVANAQTQSVVGVDASGNFVVVWQDFDLGIRAQRFDSGGNRLGAELGIEQVDRNFEQQPDLAVAANGDFVVTWDVFGGSIYARAFRADGTPKGNDLQISDATSNPFEPAVGLDAGGNPIIAWVDASKDGSDRGLFARLLRGTELENRGTAADDSLLGTAAGDSIDGDAGTDLILGGDGDDLLTGGLGDDRLLGDAGNDTLTGSAGNDRLTGGSGRDLLVGGPGRDLLDGGPGRDRLIGGAGRDRFVLRRGEGRDVIEDFQNGRDQLVLAGGLRFDDLTIVGAGRNTLIRADGEALVLLRSVPVAQITVADFGRI